LRLNGLYVYSPLSRASWIIYILSIFYLKVEDIHAIHKNKISG